MIRALLILFAVTALAQDHIPGRLLARRKASADLLETVRTVQTEGAQITDMIPDIRVLVLKVPEQARERVRVALERSGQFEFVELDYPVKPYALIPNDPLYPSQWHLAKTQAPIAWALTKGSVSIPVAIIDSGVDPAQPDLKDKLLVGWNFLKNNTDTQDAGCYVGHGTAVAGTAAAIGNNGIGVAGYAWLNPIVPLAGVWGAQTDPTPCQGNYSTWAAAFTWAANHGIRVMSISGGGFTASATLQAAVDYAWSKGTILVASAGNEGNSNPVYPAAANHVIGVAATLQSDAPATWSSYGNWIFMSAPGYNIVTTQKGGSYGGWWGTSFSAPGVAGAVLLLLSAKPSLTPQQIRDLLQANSDDLGPPGFDVHYGWGRLNVGKLLTAIASEIINPACKATSGVATVPCTASVQRVR